MCVSVSRGPEELSLSHLSGRDREEMQFPAASEKGGAFGFMGKCGYQSNLIVMRGNMRAEFGMSFVYKRVYNQVWSWMLNNACTERRHHKD